MTTNSLIETTLEKIAREYQPGALPWMKANRPNEWKKMLTIEGRVNEMALEGGLKGLREALSEYQSIILDMVREFKTIKKEKGQRMFKLK